MGKSRKVDLICTDKHAIKHNLAAVSLIHLLEIQELWLRTGTPTDMLPDFPEAQGAFKDLMTHWSCDSHYLSHFAAFFIVVGAKTSVAESVGYFGIMFRGV